MKKSLIIIFLLFISVALVGPKFAGQRFNQGLDNYITTVNETSVYQVAIINRKQHWFSSTADIQVTFDMQNLNDNSVSPEWQTNLQIIALHGPILTTRGLSLGWLDWTVDLVIDELPPSLTAQKDKPIYQAQGKMGLFGSTRYQDQIAAMTYQDPISGVNAATDGWEGSGYLAKNTFTYQGGPGNLRMSLPDVYALELRDLQVSMDVQASISDVLKGNFYDGIGSMTLQQLKIENLTSNTNTQLDKLELISDIEFDESTDLADITMEMTLAALDSADIKLTDFSFMAELNNMQQAFFKAYQQMNKDIMQSPQRVEEIMQATMQTHLLGQLQAQPQLNINKLSGMLNDGNIRVTSNNQLMGVTSLPDTMESNDFWIEHTQSTTEISVDDNAATRIANLVLSAQLASNPQLADMEPKQRQQIIEQQSELTLNSLVQQGLFVKTESGYDLSFSLQDGNATLNRQNIPLTK